MKFKARASSTIYRQDRSMYRRFTTTHLSATAALTLVIGGTVGYFLAPDGAEEAFSADSNCPEISTSDTVAEAFGRLVGSGRDLEKNGDIGSKKDNKSFTLGKAGASVASSFSAAVYLPCEPAGSKLTIKRNLDVEVTMLRTGGDADTNRSNAAQVARALADHAQSETHCESAQRLPTGPIKWT
ncbi:hypothetical protein ACGFYO_08375 [Streptomyces sp. NPDC048201]|uniref:hypothetical protein n=1 Tax=Streptomyces sp. NPDC048201 TaxID=3365513 RepID=UPI003716B031